MSSKKPRRAASEGPDSDLQPAHSVDRILLEIRKLIAASIFFNAKAAEEIGLGLTDMQMLHMLQLYGPATPGSLAKFTGLSSGGVTVALDRLEKAGYVRREQNPADRRSLLVTLMPSRQRALQGMYEGIENETRSAVASLSQGDLDAVERFFAKLREVGSGGRP